MTRESTTSTREETTPKAPSRTEHRTDVRDTGTTDRDRYVVGLMAGTSLDGIDAACCRIRREGDGPFGYEISIESFVTAPYPESIRDRLIDLCEADTGRVDEVCRLNRAIGVLFASGAERSLDRAGIQPDDVEAIGSHGQTIRHIPDSESFGSMDRGFRSTLQIGDGATIAFETGIQTVSDFRTADVAAGGHGAPLAPFLDATLFADDEETRVLQNIGGIGNCTVLPPTPDRDDIVAFDTGPGNMVVDAVVEILSDGHRTYDEDGRQAATGTPDDGLLSEFLDDDYFEEAPPKTTGRERFGREYARQFIETGRDRRLSNDDIVASATMLTARSIADAYERFADPYPSKAYVSGGGAYNDTLLSYLHEELECPVAPLDDLGMDPDSKEAALFALLAVTRLDDVPNTIPSATGANEPVVMGGVSDP